MGKKIYINANADEIINYIKNPNEKKLKQLLPYVTSTAWRDLDISSMLEQLMREETKILSSRKLFPNSMRPFLGDLEIVNAILENTPDLSALYIDWEFVPYEYITILGEILKINKILPNLKNNDAFPAARHYIELSPDEIENSIVKLKENAIKINFDKLTSSDKVAFFREVQVINQLLAFADTANKIAHETKALKTIIHDNEILNSNLLEDFNNIVPRDINDKKFAEVLRYRKELLNNDPVKDLNLDLSIMSSHEIKIITLAIKINQALSYIKPNYHMPYYYEIGIGTAILKNDPDFIENDWDKYQNEFALKGIKLIEETRKIYKKLVDNKFLNTEKLEFIFNSDSEDYLSQQEVTTLIEGMNLLCLQSELDNECLVKNSDILSLSNMY